RRIFIASCIRLTPTSELFPYTTLFRSKLPETREELFCCFPRASFPLSETDLRQCIEMRSDSTVVEFAGRVVAFANFYRWKEGIRSEEHTSELQSREKLVCSRLHEKKKN